MDIHSVVHPIAEEEEEDIAQDPLDHAGTAPAGRGPEVGMYSCHGVGVH